MLTSRAVGGRGWRSGVVPSRACGVEPAVVGGQAAPGGQVELPAVHPAGQDPVVDLPKASQVGLEVGAAALDQVAVQGEQLLVGGLLDVPALGVLQPLGREGLEEVVDAWPSSRPGPRFS
jgi:hypothetical protein